MRFFPSKKAIEVLQCAGITTTFTALGALQGVSFGYGAAVFAGSYFDVECRKKNEAALVFMVGNVVLSSSLGFLIGVWASIPHVVQPKNISTLTSELAWFYLLMLMLNIPNALLARTLMSDFLCFSMPLGETALLATTGNGLIATVPALALGVTKYLEKNDLKSSEDYDNQENFKMS